MALQKTICIEMVAVVGSSAWHCTQNQTTLRPLPLLPHNHNLLSKLMVNKMEDDESYGVVQYMDLAMF